MQFPTASPHLIEAIEIVQEYSIICEAMYLIMLADGRVRNVEREVLRGALEVLSNGRVRTAHMESLLDAAALRVADQGVERRLQAVVKDLADDPIRSETALVLCAAVAAADGQVTKEEQAILERLAQELAIDPGEVHQVTEDLLVGDPNRTKKTS
jgi:tellurite resistance protein